jgi:uncharacterized protein DUF6481
MPAFKDNDLSERREAAAAAKRATLERFRAKKDDPATAERMASRVAAARARDSKLKARKAAAELEAERLTADQKIREEQATQLETAEVERATVERRAEGERVAALLAEQKAARDSRYAARKARKVRPR